MHAQDLKLILPSDGKIYYSGRVDLTDEEAVKYSWSGVNFSFVFSGKKLTLLFDDGYNDYEVFMDGKYYKTIETTTFKKKYEIFSSTTNEKHNFKIVKRTEVALGVFKGLLVDNEGKLLENQYNPSRKFEFIGDSITCGYGIEATSPTIPNSRKYQNFTKTYAYLISEMLNADYHVVAISGKGLVRNYGEPKDFSTDPLPFYYKRTFQGIDDEWDFSKWQPDVVFIALGENDFSTSPVPSGEKYYIAYKNFIKLIRNNYPASKIVMICTMSGRDIYRETLKESYLKLSKELKDIYHFEFPLVQANEGGCDNHPNYLAHRRFAEELVEFVRGL
ncbi:MAG: SGNH/GDSL hydrolase family protein [Brevinematales bacterium]